MTVHWVDKGWQQHFRTLDIVELTKPIHSGEYLANKLLSTTNSFNITNSVFTVTRDNAIPNNTLLFNYKSDAYTQRIEGPDRLEQLWNFTKAEGDVWCIAHIINLAI